MDPSVLGQYVANGLMLGVIYAMVAVGFTLFFGVLDVIKFSHGDVLMVGAFAGLATFIGVRALGIDSAWLQLAAVVIVATASTAVLGAAIGKVLVLPLRSAPPLNTLLVTLMLGLALRELVRLFYPQGANPKPFPRLLPQDSLALGSFSLRLDNALLLAGGLAAIVAVHFIITRTRLGLAVRAVAQDAETARVMGIDFERVVLATFALGSGLAALAGVMNGLYYNEINFGIGLWLGVIGFSAAVVGGLGNIYGAILGGFLFAALETAGAVLLPAVFSDLRSAYKDVLAFAAVIALMAWRPTGLIAAYCAFFLHAESQAELLGLVALAGAGVAALARLGWSERVRESLAEYPARSRAATAAALAAILALFCREHFPMLMLASVLLYTVACLGLTVQFGYAGVVNFAGAAFFGIGAYTSAVLGAHLWHPLVVLAGGAMAALVGSLLILPVLRTRGNYAALVTVAFGLLFRTFIEVNVALGGPQGLQIKGMNLFGWDFNSGIGIGDAEISFYTNYAALALGLAALAFAGVRRLERSWVGLNLDAVRLDETASAAFGIDAARWKILAFPLGNFIAGVAGSVYGMMNGFVAPNSFTFGDSLILVSILILGGLGNPWGVALAAGIVVVLPEKLQALQEYRLLFYAVLVIAILLFRPDGLLPRRAREYLPGRKPR